MARTLHFNQSNPIPGTGFLRLAQIVGDVKQEIPPLLPISKTAWYNGVKSGIYPKPIQLNPRTTVYKVEDIKALIERLSSQQA
ncbi:MAG: AlpA family transcriptional regulator [Methyloglobulus sp.]|nr:AlpA family transcriptional regulator [Methyloglobulus sp.]